jgi:hypothetical protein
VQAALTKCGKSELASIRIAGAQSLRSGALDIFTHTAPDRERLVYSGEDWLPQLQGQHARIINHQYAILAHSTPTEFFPPLPTAADEERMKKETLDCNRDAIPAAVILYVG